MRDSRPDLTLASSTGRSAFLTYEPYYGLREKPFSLSADPRFLYKSRIHAPTFDELRAGIRRREGIIVLTGEPGTGKTTLCRGVLEALDRKTFCTMVPDPFVSREDLLKMLLIDFGVVSVDELRSGRLNAATRPELSYPLYDFLRSLVPLQAYAVLIIDEAQNLSQQLLEEIRILSDLEAPEKLLQLVLVGQPELRAKLKETSMRQVDQRVSVRCALQPLDREAVGSYVAHRLSVAGGSGDRVSFSPDAIDLLYRASNGNPRTINLIADKSLQRAFTDRTWTITNDVVMDAVGQLGLEKPPLHVAVEFPTESPDAAEEPSKQPVVDEAFAAEPKPAIEMPVPFLNAEPLGGHRVVHPAAAIGLVIGVLLMAGLLFADWQMQRLENQSLPLASIPALPAPRTVRTIAPVVPPADISPPSTPAGR